MTYGVISIVLRDTLTEILANHLRPIPHLGGPMGRGVPRRTPSEIDADLLLIQRYRVPVLQWTLALLDAVVPANATTLDPEWGPGRLLVNRFAAAVEPIAKAIPEPSDADMRARHQYTLVEKWRQAARAASEALDHELGALNNLSRADGLRAVSDACDLVRALIRLDDRIRDRSAWYHFGGSRYVKGHTHSWGLLRAAELCADWLSAHDLGQVLDARGQRTGDIDHAGMFHQRLVVTPGPYPPGVSGANDAQHNALLHLDVAPGALTLRRLIIAHRQVSYDARDIAGSVGATGLAARFDERFLLYDRLVHTTSGVRDGDTNSDPKHAWHADQALSETRTTIRLLATPATPSTLDLAVLDQLMNRIDARVATILREGARDRRYLLTTGRGTKDMVVSLSPRSASVVFALASALAGRLWAEPPLPSPWTLRDIEAAERSRATFKASLLAGRRAGRTSGLRFEERHIPTSRLAAEPGTPEAQDAAYRRYLASTPTRSSRSAQTPGIQR
ncbi:hypothetical protein ACIGB8_17550 [Promicromonospora sukumoe]|uniref:hypothetical protein n=1 Tax=Promicromonospora sukumoe TaxID=88382 RepID=UPI0037CA5B47